jgi:hypothetical protein
MLHRAYVHPPNRPWTTEDIAAFADRAFRYPRQIGQTYPESEAQGLVADLARAVQTVSNYLAQADPTERTVALEQFERAPVHNRGGDKVWTFSGRFDRVLVRPEDPGLIIIRDYKTGSGERDDLEPATVMLAIARHVYRGKYERCAVEFDYLTEDGLACRRTITPNDVRKEGWPAVTHRIMRALEATEYPAEPGDHCRFCPIDNECQPHGDPTDGILLDDLVSFFGAVAS